MRHGERQKGEGKKNEYNTATLQDSVTYVVKCTASSKIPEKNTVAAVLVMVSAPVACLRGPSFCRCLSQPQGLNPLGHRSVQRVLVSAPF